MARQTERNIRIYLTPEAIERMEELDRGNLWRRLSEIGEALIKISLGIIGISVTTALIIRALLAQSG